MTPREYVLRAVRHTESDMVPYSVGIPEDRVQALFEKFGGAGIRPIMVRQFLAFCSAQGFPREKKVQNGYVDAFGVHWDQSCDQGCCGVPSSQLFNKETFAQYEFPDPTSGKLYAHIPTFLEDNASSFTIGSIGLAYFERSWSLYGFQNVFLDMIEDEHFMFKLLDKILDFNMKILDQYCQFKFDGIHINDDYGAQQGLMMGPKLWRKFYKPGLTAMVAKIKSAGKYAYLHSCGDISEIIPDLIEIGFDIINPVQPEAMDVYRLKREYGKYLTFHGALSEQKLLTQGTPDEVEAETRRILRELGKRGGLIIAPSQNITADVPPENLYRYIKVVLLQ